MITIKIQAKVHKSQVKVIETKAKDKPLIETQAKAAKAQTEAHKTYAKMIKIQAKTLKHKLKIEKWGKAKTSKTAT